jgi:hypothetical protein
MVRMPEALRRRVEREAEKNGRSMNTEIIHRLEQSFSEVDLRESVKSLEKKQLDTSVALTVMQERLAQALSELQSVSASRGMGKELAKLEVATRMTEPKK